MRQGGQNPTHNHPRGSGRAGATRRPNRTVIGGEPDPKPRRSGRGYTVLSFSAGAFALVTPTSWMRPRVKAVDGIDLDVRRGEVFGLLGPNGSGKSTTIKMILGLLHPSSGVISVFGKNPRDVSIKNDIGYLPEDSYLYRFLNARETLDYYGKLFHQDRRKRQNRIDMLLEMVGLDKVQRRPIGEYSKGMQRRIGLAQALINDPKLLILDEPTTGMDPIGTRQIKDLILHLKDSGKTVLLCSHLLSDVEDVTDRAAIMFGGQVRRAGDMDELLTRRDETSLTTPAASASKTCSWRSSRTPSARACPPPARATRGRWPPS